MQGPWEQCYNWWPTSRNFQERPFEKIQTGKIKIEFTELFGKALDKEAP